MRDERVQVVDLDGCISDDRWRRAKIEPGTRRRADPNWIDGFHRYHSACFRDDATNLHEIIPEVPIVILTGRPVRYIRHTKQWIHSVAGLYPLYIICRNNDDNRRSVEVKQQQVEWLLDPNGYDVRLENIISAIDDRDDIVQMYREKYKLNARVVRIGDTEHAHG